MSPFNRLKGQIQLSCAKSTQKNVSFTYDGPTFKEEFEDSLTETMMSSFDQLKLTDEEKKILSRTHRKMLNFYRYLSPFSLNQSAKELIEEINQSNTAHFIIKADHYGAYVCLTALYSGKLAKNKKIEFVLEKAPLALFPKNLMKVEPKNKDHKIFFKLSEDCWLSPFSSLYNNHKIKYALKKAA